jgi:hypothetical protein
MRTSTTIAAILVAAGAHVASPPAPARADAAPTRLVVSPSEAHVAPGGTQQFAVLEDDAGAGSVAWRVVPATLGTIDASGLFTASEAPGRGIVRAERRGGGGAHVGHALVRVGGHRGPSRLRVVPESALLAPGGEIVFDVERPSDAPGSAPVAWSVVPAHAGTIGADGRFRAGAAPGRGRVVARIDADGQRWDGAAHVRIGRPGGPQPEIAVVPPAATVPVGGRARFEARRGGGSEMPTDVRWSLFPADLGRIDADGMFDAGTAPGEGRVVATVEWEGESVRAFARIRVVPPPGALVLRVEPPSALVAPGRSVDFDATLLGDVAPGPIAVRWSVVPERLGSIGPDGVLTAFDARLDPLGAPRGEVIARAVVGGAAVEGRATVRVAIPAHADLELRPRFITTTPGGQVQVRAFLDGAPLPPEIPIQWAALPPSLGTVGADGLFTANENLDAPASDDFGRREGVIAATALLPEENALKGTVRVVVVPAAPRGPIAVVPAEASVGLGERVVFRAVMPEGAGIRSAESGAADRAPRIAWLVRPERLGTITAGGAFEPNARLGIAALVEGRQSIEGRVIAELRVSPRETLRGDARIVVQLPMVDAAGLEIEPPGATLASTATLAFVARIRGFDIRELPLRAEWSVAPPALGRISPDGLFTPNPLAPPEGSQRAGLVRVAVGGERGTRREATAAVTVTYGAGGR